MREKAALIVVGCVTRSSTLLDMSKAAPSKSSAKRRAEDELVVDLEEDDDDDCVEETILETPEGGTQSRAWCWAFMQKLPSADKDKIKAKCNICNKILSAASKNGTSHLNRHVKKCKLRGVVDIRNFMIGTSSDGTQSMSLKKPQVDLDEVRKSVCYFVVSGGHSFSIVEEPGFKYMSSQMCPQFKVISRHTVRRDAFKFFSDERNVVENELANAPGRIFFTSDNWRNENTQDEYICITAHWVDCNWKLQKRIIRFGALAPPFDGLHIADDVSVCLGKWKVDDKVGGFTLDNASYNDTMVNELKRKLVVGGKQLLFSGDYFQIRCSCHIINLIVQSGMKLIDNVVDKIRCIVRHLRHSIPKKKRFYDMASQTYKLNTKKRLRGDCVVRWNSTYLMLDRALYYKPALIDLTGRDNEIKKFELDKDEWVKVSSIHEFLKVFYDVTNDFSASKTPTANLYFKGVWEIHSMLLDASKSSSLQPFMLDMILEMQKKFQKYWEDYNELLSCACVLDPRYKMAYVEFCYASLYGTTYGITKVQSIKDKLYMLLNEYRNVEVEDAHIGDSECIGSFVGGSSSVNVGRNGGGGRGDSGGDDSRSKRMKDFSTWYDNKKNFEIEKSELDKYLEEKKWDHDATCDVLAYWKELSGRYPRLAALARDILAIPVSTVPSESAFSMGKKLINPYRSSLQSYTIESLALLEDWLRAKGFSLGPSLFAIPEYEEVEEEEDGQEP